MSRLENDNVVLSTNVEIPAPGLRWETAWIPANVEIYSLREKLSIPAFAGMTNVGATL